MRHSRMAASCRAGDPGAFALGNVDALYIWRQFVQIGLGAGLAGEAVERL